MARRTPRRVGRPLALADDTAENRLLSAVRQGVPLNYAVVYAGIGRRTLYRTLERGERADERAQKGESLSPDDQVCRDFYLRMAQARSEVAVRNVAYVAKAAQGGSLTERTTRRLRDGSTETTEKFAAPDAKAAMWLLSKSFPEFARDSQQVDVSGVLRLDGSGSSEPGGSGSGSGGVAERLSARIAELAAAPRALETGDDVEDAEVVGEGGDDEQWAS